METTGGNGNFLISSTISTFAGFNALQPVSRNWLLEEEVFLIKGPPRRKVH